MPKLRFLLVLAFSATTTRGATGQSVGSQIRPLLSKGAARVEVLEPWAPPGFGGVIDSVRLRPSRTETVDVEPTPTGWRFGTATTLFALRGLEIDTVANVVHSAFGDLPATDPVVPRPTQRATGPWSGPQWSLEAFDPSTRTGTRAAFAVGKHQVTGHTVIYLNAQRVVSGQMTSRESLFLRVVR